MDERCKLAHANLMAGTCPWCGQAIINGTVEDGSFGREASRDVAVDARFCDVASLRQMVADVGPLESQRAARYVEEVARQLSSVYSLAPLHGAVRPENIFIDDTGTAELGPGICAQSGNFADVVGKSSVVDMMVDAAGVVDWLAPEQALNSTTADRRADIYSLGCTLYFLLTGRPPFGEGSISERLVKHQTADPEPIAGLRSDVPEGLAQVCAKMMTKKPDDRFQSTEEVAAALAAFR